jgi:hypothetical protein
LRTQHVLTEKKKTGFLCFVEGTKEEEDDEDLIVVEPIVYDVMLELTNQMRDCYGTRKTNFFLRGSIITYTFGT